VLHGLHRVNATGDQAARPTSDDAEDEAQDVGGCAGVGRRRCHDPVAAVGAKGLLRFRSEGRGLLDDDLSLLSHGFG